MIITNVCEPKGLDFNKNKTVKMTCISIVVIFFLWLGFAVLWMKPSALGILDNHLVIDIFHNEIQKEVHG